jgi:hypothetical protein
VLKISRRSNPELKQLKDKKVNSRSFGEEEEKKHLIEFKPQTRTQATTKIFQN